jgi:hypothetical protein
VIHYNRPAGDYGDHTTGSSSDFWGLHLWGDAIDTAELTDWTAPKPFLGEDEYGRFAFVKLSDDRQPLNFIVHQGDTKDPDNSPDRSFVPAETPEIWLRQGDVNIYTNPAQAQGFATVHYACAAACAGVTVEAMSASGTVEIGPPTTDTFGAHFQVRPPDVTVPLTVTIRDAGGAVDIAGASFTPTETPSAWFLTGADDTVYSSWGEATDTATIHYRRPAGDYGDPSSTNFEDFWGLHVWVGAATEPPWTNPVRPVGQDTFGIEFQVPLNDDPNRDRLAYILHRGETKDPGPDQFLVFDQYGYEVWQVQGADPANPYVAPPKR